MEKIFLADHRSQSIARLKAKGKTFEVMVDSSKALELRKKGDSVANVLLMEGVFYDIKKGLRPSEAELKATFGTSDVIKVAEKIIREGELQLPAEYRARAREEKLRQIVNFLALNTINPQTSTPHPPARIEQAIKEVGFKVDETKPAEEQANAALKLIQKLLPIKIETSRIAVKVPAGYAAQIYGYMKQYIIKEEWLSDGSLSAIVELPSGSRLAFFDRLNSITHGTALTKEV